MIPPRTRGCIRPAKSVSLAIGLFACGLPLAGRPAPRLEIFPKHFKLHPGERIHYTVCEFREGARPRCPDAGFATADSAIVRLVEPAGLFQAVRAGHTEIAAHTPDAQVRVAVEVAGAPETPMNAVPHAAIREIVARDLLFVGHANRDGYDHTAVAKPGIDRLIEEGRKNGWTVVYWVSGEYPDWYTADRRPDYAIVSEGQEHQIRIDARRVIFSGGSFLFCLLRNVQMTLHSMLLHHAASPVHFVFPARAIWRGPVDASPYPASMVLLTDWFARCSNDAQAYDRVVVPFLDRMILEFPVADYPADPPSPTLSSLLKDWTIVVRFGQRFERVYRREDGNQIVIIEFQDM